MVEGGSTNQEGKPKDQEPIVGSPETGVWIQDEGGTYRFIENTTEHKPLDLGTEIDGSNSLDAIAEALRGHGFFHVGKVVTGFIKKLSLSEMSGKLGGDLEVCRTIISKLRSDKFLKSERFNLKDDVLTKKLVNKLVGILEGVIEDKLQ